jgi:hypothetical protein
MIEKRDRQFSVIFVMQKITPRFSVWGDLVLLIFVIIFSLSFGPTVVFAHPGRTDSAGCHTCQTNCPNWGLSYGEYHCHRSKGIPQPKEPIKSHLNKSGASYTEPAPEYKIPTEVKSTNMSEQAKSQESLFQKLLRALRIN